MENQPVPTPLPPHRVITGGDFIPKGHDFLVPCTSKQLSPLSSQSRIFKCSPVCSKQKAGRPTKLKQGMLIIFFCAMYLETGEADQTTVILNRIQQMNSSGFPFNNCPSQCNFNIHIDMDQIKEEGIKKRQQEKENLNQCAVDLCGPPNKNPSFMINNLAFTDEEDKDILKQFDQKVKPHVRQGRNKAIQHYSNNLAKLSSELQAKPNGDKWDQTASQIIADYVSSDRQKIHNKNMAPSTRAFLSAYLEDYNSLRAEVTKQIEEMNAEEMRQFIISRRDKYDSTIKENPRFDSVDQRAWEQYTTLDTQEFMASLKLKAINVGILSERTKRPSCSEQAICKESILEEINFQKKAIQKQAQEEESYMNYCKSIFNEAISAIKQAQSFEQKLPKYIDQITKNVFADYSLQSRQQFQNVMNDTTIHLPSTDTVESNFIDRISTNSKNSPSKLGSWKEHTYSSQINQICPSSYINSLSDSTVTTYDTKSSEIRNRSMELSFKSCTFHDHGKGVLAHEIGHTISNMFHPNNPDSQKISTLSRDKYQKLRKCAKNIYKTPKQIKLDHWDHPNDSLHTEEDTADLMASMAFKDNPTHSFCMLLSTDAEGLKYDKLEHGFPLPLLSMPLGGALNMSAMSSAIQVLEADPDPHSGAFLRVLIEAQHKRTKLSSACEKVLDRFKDRINFEPCF